MKAVRPLAAASVLVALCTLAHRPVIGAATWDPIDPKELAEATPTVEKDADAEVLAWEVRISDETGKLKGYTHSVRIKIFTDRGRDAQSRVDIPQAGSMEIKDLEARSIRRDGTFAEIKPSDVFERTIVKAGGFKVKATSFVLPSVETGGIVEYRWREIREYGASQNLRLPLSRDIPVRLVRYRLVPADRTAWGLLMQGQAFQTNPTLKLTTEGGYTVVTMENVPAQRDEPFSPSSWDTDPWMLIYYDRQHPKDSDEYWAPLGTALALNTVEWTKSTRQTKRAVESLSLGNASLDEKITALVAFCRSKIKRVDVDTATAADRRKFSPNDSPTDALGKGRGTADDVLGLFVAMARDAGLDARLARIPGRDDVTFDRTLKLQQLLRDLVVAIRDGDGWRFVDPTNDHAPGGHLTWYQEGVPALVGGPSLAWATTPTAPPEWSVRTRTATLRLSEDGTIEGDVTGEYTGHTGARFKEQDDHVAPAEREAALKEQMTSRLPGAELSAIAIENITDAEKPYATRYHLKVPGYAQRTGSRLFIQPALLQKGIPAAFAEATRRHAIVFDQAWKEVDRVRIELPEGYQLESQDGPGPVAFPPFGGCTMKITATPDGRVIELTREFFAGGGQALRFPADAYASVKQFFDAVAKADGYTLTLRKSAGAGGRP